MNDNKYDDSREPKERKDLLHKIAIESPYLLQRNDAGRIEIWEVLPGDDTCENPVFTGMVVDSVEEAYNYACGPGVKFRF